MSLIEIGQELEFFSEINQIHINPIREKREQKGLIPIFGSVFRYVFGIMDAKDRENIELNIDQLYQIKIELIIF